MASVCNRPEGDQLLPELCRHIHIRGDIITRRGYLQMMSAAAAAAAAAKPSAAAAGDATRTQRMKWWHEARFGMFIHWGLYSVIGRHEWVMENEGIPVREYEQYAKIFKPK